MAKVVSLRPVDRVADVFADLDVEVVPKQKYSEDTLVDLVDDADAVFIHAENQFTGRVFGSAESLAVIGKPGSGIDNIDIEAATREGIPVLHTPGMNADAVAEYNVGLLISLFRSIPSAIGHLESGGWRSEEWEGTEIRGKTVGLVGIGNTGMATGDRLVAFDADLLATDPYVDQAQADEIGAELVELERLLRESDVVMLHARLTEDTQHLLGEEELSLLDDDAVLVNTARGQLVDEEALIEALQSGELGGAALDVFADEPPDPDNPLLELPNVITTPHLAGATNETRTNVLRTTAKNIVSVLDGESVDSRFVANPDVFDL